MSLLQDHRETTTTPSFPVFDHSKGLGTTRTLSQGFFRRQGLYTVLDRQQRETGIVLNTGRRRHKK